MALMVTIFSGAVGAALLSAAVIFSDSGLLVAGACGIGGLVALIFCVAFWKVHKRRRCPLCFSEVAAQSINGRRERICTGCGWTPRRHR